MNKSLLAGAVLAVSLFATAGSAMAAFPAWATGTVNVRSEPTTYYDNVVDKLYKGDKVWVEDCDYGWCELSDGYFVAEKYLTTDYYAPPKKVKKAVKKVYPKHHDYDYYDDVDVEIGYKFGGFEFGLSY